MPRHHKSSRAPRGRRSAALLLVALAGFATVALTGIAIAKSFTVKAARNVTVTDLVTHASKRETIVVSSSGLSVYTLSGETAHHLKCTSSMCLGFWPPVKVHSAHAKLSKGPGVKGKLGIVHRKGFLQLTLNGHPLYLFKLDQDKKGVAMGEGVVSFGGTWHVIKASSSGASSGGRTGTGTTSSSPAGATMPPSPYPY